MVKLKGRINNPPICKKIFLTFSIFTGWKETIDAIALIARAMIIREKLSQFATSLFFKSCTAAVKSHATAVAARIISASKNVSIRGICLNRFISISEFSVL